MNVNEVTVTDEAVDTMIDVVEYEVEGEKKSRRGRKKKVKGVTESIKEETSPLDRTCPVCNRVLNYASSMAGERDKCVVIVVKFISKQLKVFHYCLCSCTGFQ